METHRITYKSPINCSMVYILDFSFNRKTRQATLKGSIIPKKLLDTLHHRGYTVKTILT